MIGKWLDSRAAVIAAELAEARRLRELGACWPIITPRRQAPSAKPKPSSPRRAPKSPASPNCLVPISPAQIGRRAQAAQDKIAQAEAAAMQEIRALAADAAVAAAQKLIQARMASSAPAP